MLNLPSTLPLLSILFLIIHSLMAAEVVAVAPAPSPTSSSDMAVVQAQTQALITIKDAITHDPSSCLSSWTTTTSNTTSDVAAPPSYCSFNGTAGWFGLLCDDSFHITSLNLSSCNLSGSISPSLALLPSLSLLDLSHNNFSGPLLFFTRPNSSLTYLDLSYNVLLSGDIPSSLILNSPNLQTLSLQLTGLSGVVPPELWTHLPALQQLSIIDGSLLDSSPPLLSISPTSFPPTANFAFCATIQVFDLQGLDASEASFPSSLGDCQPLQTLILSTTGLQGSIPPSIWQLPHLQVLAIQDLNVVDAVNNYPDQPPPYKLQGSLPSTLGFCGAAGSTMKEIYIIGINLTGQIPTSIATCVSLQTLDLSITNLEGSIPASLGNLTQLQTLILSSTGLQGSIPPSIWQLPHLQYLAIEDLDVENAVSNDPDQPPPYKLHGSLPSTFGFCGSAASTMEEIYIRGINLTGQIPTSIATCTSLQTLHLSITNLEGSIPSSLGNLTQLQTLFLSTTGLQGSIPPSIWQLPHLQKLVIKDINVADTVDNHPYEPRPYKLHGSLPSTFGFCTAAGSTIEHMSIDGINLTGQIPASIGTCASLQNLDLSHTNLVGPIPSSLGNLTQLQTLALQSNNLTGKIPATLSSCSQLTQLHLGFNPLRGSIPSELGMLINLQVLSLFTANLEGPVPVELCNCTQIEWFDVGWMQESSFANYLPPGYPASQGLTGSIPECFSRMANLQTLAWQLSHIEGEFPTKALQNLTQLQYLDLTYCGLDATFPPDFDWNFPNLQHLKLEYNHLRGSIPPQMGQLPNLKLLHLGSNNLNGTIPEQLLQGLAQYSTVTTLYLGGNALEGSISSSFCGITRLQTLVLGPNSFKGSIPACFGRLEGLTNLDLGHNNLTGSIPPSLGRLINTESLSLNNNELSGQIPLEIGALTKLQKLDFSTNSLEGIVPVDALNNLSGLLTLRLSQNNLSGKIESLDLSKMPNLQTFGAYGNALEGGLPAGLTENKELLIFDVQGNKYLTGSLGNTTTADITGLSNLRVLSVSYNQLSGDIPGWVWKLPSLQALDLSNNRFSGRFPASLTHLSYFKLNETSDRNQTTLYEEVPVTLKNTVYILNYVLSTRIYFDVSMNDLEGEIPVSFGELQGLTGANLSHNRISGTIPAGTFGRLMQLEVLDLSYNQLSGSIPQDLTSLGSLSTLNLAHNQLEGPIPTQNNFDTRFSYASFENNPGLCGYPISSSCNTSIDDASSDMGTTARQTQQSIVIWLNEFVSPWALLVGYPTGLALGIFVCRTLS